MFIIGHGADHNRLARTMVAPQRFWKQFGVVLDQAVGGLQNSQGRPVILLQLDHLQLRVIFSQLAQVFNGGAAPGINGLVIITHRSEHGAWPCNQAQQIVLASIGVLHLIHQQITQTVLPPAAHFFVTGQQAGGFQNQVIKIHSLVSRQGGLVAFVQACNITFFFGSGLRQSSVWVHKAVFPQ